MVFMPYLLTLGISLPSWAAFKWLFWNLCGLAPLLQSCMFSTLAPKTNSARFVRQDLPFMELGRYIFISSYFSRCWVISFLLTSLKSCLWLKKNILKKMPFCRFGARLSAAGSEFVCVCVCAPDFMSIYIGWYLLQICLGFHLSLLIDAQKSLLCISFSLPLFNSWKWLKPPVTGHLMSPAVPLSSVG